MVRLKASWRTLLVPLAGHFNSTMVRLKDNCVLIGLHTRSHFNSTMVRLKDVQSGQEPEQLQQFQFHYGTIKRPKFL